MLLKLHGEIGEMFVPEIELFVNRPCDVIDILDANFGNFRQYFIDRGNDLFDVVINGIHHVTQLELNFFFPNLQTIDIYPAISGSGSGTLQGILGLGLGIAALAIPGFQILGLSATYLGVAGGLMAIKGFFGSKKGPKKVEDGKKQTSELYNGSINGSGNEMVPIIVGRISTGSITVSIEVTTILKAIT